MGLDAAYQDSMLTEGAVTETGNALEAAKEHIHVGPVPEWVVPCSFAMDFKPKQPGQASHLLWCKQIHAEKHETFIQTVVRLETIQAVQNNLQGRIAFDPSRQQFTLHWVKIHRGGEALDRTSLDNFRCVQREKDGFISPNRVTLMLSMDDVRPGDALDFCYTVGEPPALGGDYCEGFCAMTGGAAMGRHYFSVRFHDGRPLHWKSSTPDLRPEETRVGDEIQWAWSRENFSSPRPEENTPPWHLAYPWIQVSDYPDWGTIAGAFAEAWKLGQMNGDLAAMAPEVLAEEGGILQQVEKAIRLVQDQCRHVTVEEGLDGQPPAAPEEVARRRFGDSKELSVLLMVLLKQLGLEARLVLVSAAFRKSVANFLPMPSLFDHLVVEYKPQGQTCWVDATAKDQGGGALHHLIPEFGVGLPVAESSFGLIEAPAPVLGTNIYQIKESVLVDTAGASSVIGIVVMGRGKPAEELRMQLESEGIEGLERLRLRLCMDRFGEAKRAGPLEYRDNRNENEFFLAEVFEVHNLLKEDTQSGWHRLDLATEAVAKLLPMPVVGTRRAPFALPYPCHVAHIQEVYCLALPPSIAKQRTIETRWARFSRLRQTLAGYWMVTTSLTTFANAVMPEDIEEYRKAERSIRTQCGWAVLVPAGQDRPHQRNDFGKLPPSWEATVKDFPAPATPAGPPSKAAKPAPAAGPDPRGVVSVEVEPPALAQTAAGTIQVEPASAAGESTAEAPSDQSEHGRRRRHRKRRDVSPARKYTIFWQAVLGFCLMVVLLLVVYVFITHVLISMPVDETP
jgi:hypothetical protein